jgi:hypothetical protein
MSNKTGKGCEDIAAMLPSRQTGESRHFVSHGEKACFSEKGKAGHGRIL